MVFQPHDLDSRGVPAGYLGSIQLFVQVRRPTSPMSPLRVSRRSVQRRYKERTRQLLQLAVDMPGRPSPEEIHDLRVAARRIQVIRKLLPGEVRESQASKTFDLALRSVLKSTSQLRDLDTLVDTLKAHKADLPSDLLVALEIQRSDVAARAKAAISVLTEVPAPDLEPAETRGKKVSRRLRKRVKRRNRTISQLLMGVLGEESKVDELHTLRKEVKKMRYLLELADGAPSQLRQLMHWQESLGVIHDLDVAVAYLEKLQFDFKRRAILDLTHARHVSYLKFVRDYRTRYLEGERPPIQASDSAFSAY